MIKKLWMVLAMAATLLLAGCGGGDDGPAPTVVGTYSGNISFVLPGAATLNGPANLTIASNYQVTGGWTAVQTPPGITTAIVFSGTATPGGSITVSGYNGATEVMRLVGTANAETGVVSGTFVLSAAGLSGTYTLTR